MGIKIPHKKEQFWAVVQPIEKHWESVLRCFTQQEISNGVSETAAAGCKCSRQVGGTLHCLPPVKNAAFYQNSLTTCFEKLKLVFGIKVVSYEAVDGEKYVRWLLSVCVVPGKAPAVAVGAYEMVQDAADGQARIRMYWQVICTQMLIVRQTLLVHSMPLYLGPLVTVTDLSGQRALQSVSTSCLVILPIKLSTVGSRAFPVAAAQVWTL